MKHSKILQRVLGTVLAVACLASLSIPASAIEIELPETPMSVYSTDGTRYLTTTAQRASSEIPLILGINIVGGNLFDGTLTMAGTSVNDNPDPYVWNYNYLYPSNKVSGGTSYTGDPREGAEDFDPNAYYQIVSSTTSSEGMVNGNGLYSSGGANQIMAGTSEEFGGVSYGVYKMIDVWIGFYSDVLEQINFIQNEMDKASPYYQEGYATYNPLITDVATGTVTSRAYAWVEMGNALSAYLKEHPELSVRYGDPKALCYNIQEFAFGIPYYVDSLIASGKIEKITGACINATSDDGLTFTTIDPATAGNVKADAYAVGNTVNWLTGNYTMSDLKAAGVDVIVIYTAGYGYTTGSTAGDAGGGAGGAGGSAASSTLTRAYLEKLMEDVGYTKETAPVVIDAANESVTPGTNGYNYAPTTPLFVPYITAYMYMEQLADLAASGDPIAAAVNPTAMFQYMCDEFLHIKDDSAYTITTYYIGTKWDATDSDLDKVPAVASGDYVYDKNAIVSAIQAGIKFALNNQDNESVYLNGAYRQGEVGYELAQMLVESGSDSFAEILNAANGDYSGITYDYENNQEHTTLDITPLVEFYGIDGLAELVDDYAAHMNNHPWIPDTSVPGTYGYTGGFSFKATTGTYTDVSVDSTYYDAAEWAYANGITTGTSTTELVFSPYMTSDRAQVVTTLYRLAGEPAIPANTVNPFTDVNTSDWYYNAVLWAVANGITTGTNDGTTFSPMQTCSRSEVLAFLYRYEGQPSVSGTTGFTDLTADWYQSAIKWAVSAGVADGITAKTFSPLTACPRYELFTFLYKTMA